MAVIELNDIDDVVAPPSSMLAKVTKGKQSKPRRTVLYGVHGVGKSTFAADWPDAIFVPTEDGVSDLDVASFPLCSDLDSAWQAIIELGSGNHDYRTCVVDSADWLERLIWKKVCQKDGKKAITDFGYGSGYGKSAAIFSDVLSALNGCRSAGMHVVVLAHCEIKRFENPEGDSYDRYCPKLHRDTASLLQEWADEVLFTNYKVHVRKTDEGFNKDRGVGIGTGERIIYTSERPGYMAKNRLGLPHEVPLSFEAYKKFLS
jgi:hypothetical protein